LNDETVKGKLAGAKKLSEVNVEDYDVIFYVGGHGPVIDLAQDPVNIKLASRVSFKSWTANTRPIPNSFTNPTKSWQQFATGLRALRSFSQNPN
jgi:hypothetical protein